MNLSLTFSHTAGVDQPGFRILSGNILLGPRPDLLDFAAPYSSEVSVNAASTPRTAIVQRSVQVTINCSDWLDDNPGDDEYISRTQLDQFGNEVGDEMRLETNSFGDNLFVDEEAVTITGARFSEEPSNSDSAIYMCHSCMESADGLLTNCHSASVTLYVIGSAPEIDAAADDGEHFRLTTPYLAKHLGW